MRKLKSLIYPLAFVMVIILSVIYKFVFKGSGDFTIEAFKSGKTTLETAGVQESNTQSSQAQYSESETAMIQSEETAQTVEIVSVYICGEVNNPGIYEAPKGVMLNEIIEDAGGLTAAASAANINLVYQIECNMSIYIPSVDEIAQGFTGGDIIRSDGVYVWGTSQGGATETVSNGTQIVNINTAGKEELMTLPGIGEVTAQAIIDYRTDTPFTSIEDIKNVTGIGDSKFNRIKDYICV